MGEAKVLAQLHSFSNYFLKNYMLLEKAALLRAAPGMRAEKWLVWGFFIDVEHLFDREKKGNKMLPDSIPLSPCWPELNFDL